MSGGIAYVLDLRQQRVNVEMVDLDPVERGGREVPARRGGAPLRRTDSAVAARLLSDWDASRFTKVMPKDYKRVLSAATSGRTRGP